MSELDLPQALQALAGDDPTPASFERVARWRLAAGDADAAGRWRLWSLIPPDPDTLRLALAQAWLLLGDQGAAQQLLPEQPTWENLLLLLQRDQLPEAVELQTALLSNPPPIDQPNLLAIAQAWQEKGQPGEALQLLEPLVLSIQRRQQVVAPALANALAHLLEQQERFEAAEPWWQHSLQLDPAQPWPIMRLARQALRQQQPCLCWHYCEQVLQQDPQHPHAPGLLQRALGALKARGSLALLGAPVHVHHAWHRRQQGWREAWQTALAQPLPPGLDLLVRRPVQPLPEDCVAELSAMQEWALWGDGDGLVLWPLLQRVARKPRRIWLLASADPLLQQHNLEALTADIEGISWLRWPVADPQKLSAVEAVLIAHRPPLPLHRLDLPATAVVWQECAGPHRWERQR